jgi:hypothetical protein
VADVAASRAPEVLAVRAVELLRASLLEATVHEATTAQQAPLPADVAHWMKPAVVDRTVEPPSPAAPLHGRGGLGLGLGAAMIGLLRGSPPAFAPVLRASYGGESWSGRLSVVAPALGSRVSAEGGAATIRQECVTLEVVGTWPARSPIAAVLSAGAGAYHWHVTGEASSPYVAHSGDSAGALFDAGAGVAIRLGASAGFLADVHALGLAPGVDVAIAGSSVKLAGTPLLLTTAGFWVTP